MLLKNGIINGEGFEECFLKFPASCFSTENDLKTHSGVILSFCWAWGWEQCWHLPTAPNKHGAGALIPWQWGIGHLAVNMWPSLSLGLTPKRTPVSSPHMRDVWPTQAWLYRVTIPWVGDCASPTASTPLRGLQHEVLWAKPSLQTLKLGCRVGLCVPGCAPL